MGQVAEATILVHNLKIREAQVEEPNVELVFHSHLPIERLFEVDGGDVNEISVCKGESP
jgi:hypothetical protein